MALYNMSNLKSIFPLPCDINVRIARETYGINVPEFDVIG